MFLGLEPQTAPLYVYSSRTFGLHQDHRISSCKTENIKQKFQTKWFISTIWKRSNTFCYWKTYLFPGIPLDPFCVRWPNHPHLELAESLLCVHPDGPQPLCDVRALPPRTGPDRIGLAGLYRAGVGHLRYKRQSRYEAEAVVDTLFFGSIY